MLELELVDPRPGTPFKFNPGWLADDEFIQLVKDTWLHYDLSKESLASEQFMVALKSIKKKVTA